MMTNGVVHANVFGIKDWVSPYKISVLALLYEMTSSKITLPERRRLNKLILPLQQVHFIIHLTLGQFLKTVEECCPQTAYAVKRRSAARLCLGYISQQSLCSVGLFMRHMLLAYNKLSFSQVYKLYKSLQHYYHSHYAKPTDGQVGLPALAADDSEMDLTSIEDTVGDRVDKEELDAPLHESELR
ncbi:hypothetical protein XENOCAPTIV_021272 [Xenoophorus captivus]|uniref:Anaphase-promoting complex subunit 5 N-terminal domain-containing protein n=1 Tax=Xenoophorus captivus TaxID=1517983 RepID=A0ABV0RMT1_9TELE